ncbi:TPA: hypothetical protein ACM36I_000786 [Escherichia coli]|nr:hypothetical protein [Escherichia coli]EIY1675176.1 hypothetical protein [Escherichia coli]
MNENDKLDFINHIEANILYDNSDDLARAIIGDESTKIEFVKHYHYDLEYLEYFLSGAISALGEERKTRNRDLKIKDVNEALELINEQTKEDKVRLAEHLILWFEYVSMEGAYNALSRFKLTRSNNYE